MSMRVSFESEQRLFALKSPHLKYEWQKKLAKIVISYRQL